MATQGELNLSRRERQIMDVIFRRGEATAAEVMEELPQPPSYSSVRTLLRILEEKGHLRHKQVGPRYVFMPTVRRDEVRRSALQHLVHTFFGGSIEQAMAALLEISQPERMDLERLSRMIEHARKEGR